MEIHRRSALLGKAGGTLDQAVGKSSIDPWLTGGYTIQKWRTYYQSWGQYIHIIYIYILYNQLISADVEAIIYTGRAPNKMAYDLRIDTSSIHSSKPGYKTTWKL